MLYNVSESGQVVRKLKDESLFLARPLATAAPFFDSFVARVKVKDNYKLLQIRSLAGDLIKETSV